MHEQIGDDTNRCEEDDVWPCCSTLAMLIAQFLLSLVYVISKYFHPSIILSGPLLCMVEDSRT